MELGWASCRAMAGASSLPRSDWEQLGQLCPLTRERRQCWCPVHTTPLAACHSRRARSGAGGTGQAPEGAGSRQLRAGWHERPGTEQQAFPTASQGTPSSQHTPAGRNGSAQHCAQHRGMGAARTWNGLSSTRDLCGNLRAVRLLWSEGSPAMARSSPTSPPASPLLLRTHK